MAGINKLNPKKIFLKYFKLVQSGLGAKISWSYDIWWLRKLNKNDNDKDQYLQMNMKNPHRICKIKKINKHKAELQLTHPGTKVMGTFSTKACIFPSNAQKWIFIISIVLVRKKYT